jgi:5'-methylthioadenosine phosphorylase
LGELQGRPIACLARHSEEKVLPPHRVNYRANIAALATVGATGVVATNAVGSLRANLLPGALCIPAQILDFTKGTRPVTFFEDEMRAVDFTQPYCPHLSNIVGLAAREVSEHLHLGLVYACTEGPRFETAAEVRMLRRLGADIVGMTAIPEAVLAREKGLCYAALCVVTNLGAGIGGHHPSSEEVLEAMDRSWHVVMHIIEAVVTTYVDEPTCPCHKAL